ncbi:prephenate dehydrogenase [Arthrobacter glacialis]|uniref:Prephenate dehydrogenase n=1 Tax=Arthrobacter glacialis TaxID=1664 RepID=A0A2S3ZUF1_ARTGL|nr:prephenate dehydrogenase [Arthrobacter glacialis]POH58174.1 prephenate dehydrogenase [Arthrobacter glacialis]POH72891.1 prephenate dehydrogenase [Arthrobacter glacialis]
MNPSHLLGPVLVLGSGLLGASIGLGLRARGVDVVLSDPSPSAQAVAVDIGAGRALELAEPLNPELVVVAAPPDVSATVVAAALRRYPSAVVVDIASVKFAVLAELRTLVGEDLGLLSRYVGTHPMAGRERSGPVAARGELFNSMPWVLCPSEVSSAHAVKVAHSLAIDLDAVVFRFSPEEHDEAVALVSHLPQIMSSLVASRLAETPAHALSLAGNGLRDVTRIAASDPSLWVQILGANAPKLLEIMQGVRLDLDRLISTLSAPTAPGARLDLAQLMAEGNAGQSRIPGKHGGPPQQYSWLTVLVDDKPGQIAKLLTEIGEIGVNVEDLRLDHSAGLQVGMVELSVLPSKRVNLVQDLTERGWKVIQ